MEKMSTGQYGKLVGLTRQDVHYRIKTNQTMPGVIKYETIAGRVILTVNKKSLKKVS